MTANRAFVRNARGLRRRHSTRVTVPLMPPAGTVFVFACRCAHGAGARVSSAHVSSTAEMARAFGVRPEHITVVDARGDALGVARDVAPAVARGAAPYAARNAAPRAARRAAWRTFVLATNPRDDFAAQVETAREPYLTPLRWQCRDPVGHTNRDVAALFAALTRAQAAARRRAQ
jgi:hypothetical protein